MVADTAQRTLRQAKARDLFIAGSSLQMLGGKHAQAILEFQEALSYDTTAAILSAMARSYKEIGKTAKALQYLNDALYLDSTFASAWEMKAEILIDNGSYDEAIEAYEHIQLTAPSLRQLYTLGRLYEPRDARKAADVFERVSAIRSDKEILSRLVDLYTRLRAEQSRTSALERLYALDQFDGNTSMALLDAYIARKDYARAIVILEQWRDGSSLEASRMQWATVLSAILLDTLSTSQIRDTVIGLANQVTSLYPRDWRIAALAGAVYMHAGDTLSADRSYERFTAFHSGYRDAQMFYQMATAQMAQRRFDAAQRILHRGLEEYPAHILLHLLSATCFSEQGKIPDAIGVLKNVLVLDPTIVDAWIQLALLYDNSGYSDSSDQAYQHVLDLDPSNALASNNLAYSLSVRGIELDRARTLAWSAVQQAPSNASYLDTYAWVLYRAGDYEQARSIIDRAVSKGGKAVHYEHLGDILLRLGDMEGAIAAWKEAIARGGSTFELENKIQRTR